MCFAHSKYWLFSPEAHNLKPFLVRILFTKGIVQELARNTLCRFFYSMSNHCHCLFIGVSQQERRGELQQGGQPGEGLRGQIQARPQKMKSHRSVGAPTPSQTNSAAQVQFPPRAGIRLPNRETTESPSFLISLPFIEWWRFFSIEFHILLEKKETTQSEIVMQEPFILRRSCDFGNYCRKTSSVGTVDATDPMDSEQPLTLRASPLNAGWYDQIVPHDMLIA